MHSTNMSALARYFNRSIRPLVLSLALAVAFGGVVAYSPLRAANASAAQQAYGNAEAGYAPLDTDPFVRSELYFGTNRPDQPPVSDEEWEDFLDNQVTPRFPDGLTVVKGYGQFRNSSGVTIEESSIVLILLYPVEARAESSVKIEEIRDLYEESFDQESVLRVDDILPARVSF